MSTTTRLPKTEHATRRMTAVALLLATFTAQAGVTDAFTARFSDSHSGLGLGAADFSLQPAQRASCYIYTGHAHPNVIARLFTGEITDVSRFCIAGGTLRPQRFSHHVTGQPQKSYRLDFDWPQHQVIYKSETGAHKTMALGERALDPLSIHIAARRWVARADDPTTLDTTPFVLVDKDEIKTYRLRVSDGGPVATPDGTFDTLRVERADANSHAFRFWLARWACCRSSRRRAGGHFVARQGAVRVM